MMFWYDHDMSGWGYAWMGIGMVVFWAVLITGFVLLVKYATQTGRTQPPGQPPPTAEQILAERFARGEIDRDEYLKRLETLRGPATIPTRTTPPQ
ncbi:SHOCT domain-containing protein [Nocardia gipuzkoensis]|uniref:SHOCT domain-containing protein n=1 Tax=Nocardia gipuzkoensis TaxID=2749991 RepID=UPI001E2DBB39|nr:SHOCT domain-containing protein [Nocardia gipuzkoensis]UGT72393.1 SHOCT domain-containing protein [Nocardia gipuzkoensis]